MNMFFMQTAAGWLAVWRWFQGMGEQTLTEVIVTPLVTVGSTLCIISHLKTFKTWNLCILKKWKNPQFRRLKNIYHDKQI